nr:hypothetical protein [bacterium]
MKKLANMQVQGHASAATTLDGHLSPHCRRRETLELAGSSSATMSQKTACAIDGAIGRIGGAKGSSSMDAQAAKEHHSKLYFHIEF